MEQLGRKLFKNLALWMSAISSWMYSPWFLSEMHFLVWSLCSLDSSPGPQKPRSELMAGIQADHWRWMTFTWVDLMLKEKQQRQQQLFVGICGYWENSLADSRLDFTEKSPRRTEVALEFVQSSISAIWSQPSDSDYEHTPNGCLSFMSLCVRAALRFIQRGKTTLCAACERGKSHEEKQKLTLEETCHSHWGFLSSPSQQSVSDW